MRLEGRHPSHLHHRAGAERRGFFAHQDAASLRQPCQWATGTAKPDAPAQSRARYVLCRGSDPWGSVSVGVAAAGLVLPVTGRHCSIRSQAAPAPGRHPLISRCSGDRCSFGRVAGLTVSGGPQAARDPVSPLASPRGEEPPPRQLRVTAEPLRLRALAGAAFLPVAFPAQPVSLRVVRRSIAWLRPRDLTGLSNVREKSDVGVSCYHSHPSKRNPVIVTTTIVTAVSTAARRWPGGVGGAPAMA